MRALPKTIPGLIDRFFKVRTERLAEMKKIEHLGKEESACRTAIQEAMNSKKLTAAGGKLGKVEVKKKRIVQVEDWDKFYSYIKKTNSFDLLGRSTKAPAVFERIDDGKKIPGIITEHVNVLSMSAKK